MLGMRFSLWRESWRLGSSLSVVMSLSATRTIISPSIQGWALLVLIKVSDSLLLLSTCPSTLDVFLQLALANDMWMECCMLILGENFWELVCDSPCFISLPLWTPKVDVELVVEILPVWVPECLPSTESHRLPPLPWAGSVWEKQSLVLCTEILL